MASWLGYPSAHPLLKNPTTHSAYDKPNQKYFFDVIPPDIQFLRFLGPFSRVNSEIPNARILEQTILEMSYEMDFKNVQLTFETFFSQIQLRDTVSPMCKIFVYPLL